MSTMLSQKIRRALLSPVVLFSVVIMIVNDHMLKGSGVLHHDITGKLSDFAFLFFVPIVAAYLFRVKTLLGLGISYSLVCVSFAAINLSAYVSRLAESLFHMAFLPLTLWPDKTDLIALTIVPFSLFLVLGGKNTGRANPFRWKECGVVVVSALACAATGPYGPPPTHEPIYMPWKEFRASAQVTQPREIMKRGKIYVDSTGFEKIILARPEGGSRIPLCPP